MGEGEGSKNDILVNLLLKIGFYCMFLREL